MNIYQPALNAYQHGMDQSLEGMFKLAAAPTPAATFMDSLAQREQLDYNRQRQEEQDRRAEQEQARKMKHEDYLFNKLRVGDENADERQADSGKRTAILEERMKNAKSADEANLIMRGLEIEARRNAAHASAMMLMGRAEDARKYKDRELELEEKRYNLDFKWKSGQMAPGGGRLQAGYEPDPVNPGAVRPIQGGPAAQKVGAANAQTDTKMAAIDQSADSLIEIANELKNHRGLGGVTGIRGAVPDIPGSDAANARALVETIKAKAGFNYLQSMREASKTGGAIGQVSDFEQRLLQNAITALSTSQDAESFKRNLDRLIEYTQNSRTRIRGAFESLQPGGVARSEVSGSGAKPDRQARYEQLRNSGLDPASAKAKLAEEGY